MAGVPVNGDLFPKINTELSTVCDLMEPRYLGLRQCKPPNFGPGMLTAIILQVTSCFLKVPGQYAFIFNKYRRCGKCGYAITVTGENYHYGCRITDQMFANYGGVAIQT